MIIIDYCSRACMNLYNRAAFAFGFSLGKPPEKNYEVYCRQHIMRFLISPFLSREKIHYGK